MVTINDVAKYFLKLQDEKTGDMISNMKLQKLVYYAQGFHLAITDSPLFPETLEAWDYGPVCDKLYQEYKEYGAGAIPTPDDNEFYNKFTKNVEDILDMVQTYYGQFSAWKLSELTHKEYPWLRAWNKGKNTPISHDDMKSYFKAQLISE